MLSKKNMLSIIVPIMNEEEGLRGFVKVVEEEVAKTFESHEIIFVDALSTDRSFEIIKEINQTNPNVKCLRATRKFKIDPSIMEGLKYATGDFVTVVYADLQDHPRYLKAMHKVLDENADVAVVYGVRIGTHGDAYWTRRVKSICYHLINLLSDVYMPPESGDFMLMRKKVADVVQRNCEMDPYFRGLVRLAGFKQVPFEYVREKRVAGKSKIVSFGLNDIASFLFFLTGTTFAPIYFLFLVALVLLLTSVAVLSIEPITHGVLYFVVIVACSINLFAISVLGFYVSRVYKDVRGRERFLMDEMVGFD